MPYPWPSFGGFKFQRSETAIWGTDAGWARNPGYARQRTLGSATDVVTTLSIGSAERSFEVYLTPARFAALEQLLSSKALFTDWGRPVPDSRNAVLFEVSPLEDAVSYDPLNTGIPQRKRRIRITLVSA